MEAFQWYTYSNCN